MEELLEKIKSAPEKSDSDYLTGDWHSGNTIAVYGEEFRVPFISGEKGNKDDSVSAKEMRGTGKTIGLSLLYGGTEYTVSEKLKIPKHEAGIYVDKFKRGVPVFTRFTTAQINQARKDGLVKDLFGRVRYLPHINNKEHWGLRAQAERQSLNFPVQGSGGSQLKLMLITSGDFIERNRLNRTHTGLMAEYNPYTRIVSVSSVTDELVGHLERVEDGNCKLIVVGPDGTPVQEYDRNLRLSMEDINKFDMKVIW